MKIKIFSSYICYFFVNGLDKYIFLLIYLCREMVLIIPFEGDKTAPRVGPVLA